MRVGWPTEGELYNVSLKMHPPNPPLNRFPSLHEHVYSTYLHKWFTVLVQTKEFISNCYDQLFP